MGSFGRVALKEIWEMLDHCAAGYTTTATKHHHRVHYNGITFPSLPLGEHGRRVNVEIQIGIAKHMIRHLRIDKECAKKFLVCLR